MDGARFAKAHLALLRVHVDVDLPRVERQPQHIRGLTVVMQQVAVRLAQRVREHAIAHEAPVDECILAGELRRVRGLHGEALERERPGFRLDRRRAVDERVAQESGNARATPVREQPMDDAAVVLQREPDLGVRERDAPERFVAMAPLGRLGAQEFTPGRRVEVELLDGHRSAFGERRGCGRADGAAVDLDPPGVRTAGRARGEREARHRGNRGERFAAKAERRDRREIVDGRELRRRVPGDRQLELVALDARAVVGDTDPPDAAAGEIDVDLRCTGVERILEKLFERGRRAFNDFACRDLVDQQVGKRANLRHRGCRSRALRRL